MSIPDEIERLNALRAEGALTEQEFQDAKQRVISGQTSSGLMGGGRLYGVPENVWCTLMHLSKLITWSGVGIAAPIIMWIISKEESDLARRHGARMMNWLISSLIYAFIAGILCLVVIGIPLLVLLVVLTIAFPIIAAMKSSSGEVWSYPLTIRFLDEG